LTDSDQAPLVARVVRLLDANKAKAAFLAPVAVAALAAIGNWIATGTLDATEIRTAAAGVVAGLAASIGAYAAPAGRAEITTEPDDHST
jgi:multidrug resistance efflux pump